MTPKPARTSSIATTALLVALGASAGETDEAARYLTKRYPFPGDTAAELIAQAQEAIDYARGEVTL